MKLRRRLPRRLLIDLVGVGVLAALAVALRTWVLAIYAIPSASMIPTLLAGDYLLVERWRFAARHEMPARGDIIIFHGAREDYAKRVIGLPGDHVALASGRIVLNGKPLPRWRIADLILDIEPNTPCLARAEAEGCRYQRYREMLPGGRLVDTIDLGPRADDDMAAVTVPPGRLFVLGDNRDRSGDSRLIEPAGGTGLVPAGQVIGTAGAILMSVDGSARLASPRSWIEALRPDRLGARF